MQSCWEADPAARPDMLKIQQAMHDILPRVETRPTVTTFPPITPLQIQPLPPNRVSPTIDGGSAQGTNSSSSESPFSSILAPLTPPPPSGGLQLTLVPSPTILSPRVPELEVTGILNEGSTTPSLRSLRLPPLREDDYEPHCAVTSIPQSTSPMAPPQFYRSSQRLSTLSSQPTLASDFLGRMSRTSSESDILTISELDEGMHPTLI